MLDDDEVERALVIVAHPDDVDFGAAGTVSTWTGGGIDVTYCIVTDGDAGGFDPSVPRAEIPGLRRAEQTAAAKGVGVAEVWMMASPVRNRWVDITDALPRKLDALRSHISQHTDADGKLEERMRGWGAMVAQEAGLPEGRLAEGFFAIDSAG